MKHISLLSLLLLTLTINQGISAKMTPEQEKAFLLQVEPEDLDDQVRLEELEGQMAANEEPVLTARTIELHPRQNKMFMAVAMGDEPIESAPVARRIFPPQHARLMYVKAQTHPDYNDQALMDRVPGIDDDMYM